MSALQQPGRTLPNAPEAEEAVLSAILLHGTAALDQVQDILQARHFWSGARASIYEAAEQLALAGAPIDCVQVAEWLRARERLQKVGGAAYLAQLANETPAVSNVRAHAEILLDRWRLRSTISTCLELAALGFTAADGREFLAQAEQQIYALSDQRAESTTQHISSLVRSAFEKVAAAAETNDPVTGLRTGLVDLDRRTTGLQDGDVVVVAARPGLGKTAFALGIALNVAKSGAGVAVFSQEMPGEQLALRAQAHEARVDLLSLRSGRLDKAQWRELAAATARISALPFWIDEAPALRLADLGGKVRRLRAQHGKPVRLVVVDYLQLMTGSGDNREQEIAGITRGLKKLAKELCVPVVVLSQLNRAVESRADKRPQLSDLRESGAVEQDADIVVFLYRDDYYNQESPERGIAEVDIAKQRNGPTGRFRVRFDAACTRFDNLQESL